MTRDELVGKMVDEWHLRRHGDSTADVMRRILSMLVRKGIQVSQSVYVLILDVPPPVNPAVKPKHKVVVDVEFNIDGLVGGMVQELRAIANKLEELP